MRCDDGVRDRREGFHPGVVEIVVDDEAREGAGGELRDLNDRGPGEKQRRVVRP
jgi:hypothetical protein